MKKDLSIKAVHTRVYEGEPVIVRGSGWPDCPAHVTLGKKLATIDAVLQGQPLLGGVRPKQGEFVLRIATYGVGPGRYDLRVADQRHGRKIAIEICKRPRPSREEQHGDVGLAYWRSLAHFERRFGRIGRIPAGMVRARMGSIQELRRRWKLPTQPVTGHGLGKEVFFSLPVPGGSNWVPLGPAPIIQGGMWPAHSGRVISIAIDPGFPNRIYLGTCNGGVWKSTDAGASWSAKTDDQPSLAIGALAIDPNATNRVFAGTGEYHHGDPYNGYYGQGLLYSSDHGETWTQLAAGMFERVEISRILFDPNDTASHMFLASDAGVYESTSGGTIWTQLRAGSASELLLTLTPGSPPSLQLIAGFYGEGILTSTLTAGVWSNWVLISSPAFATSFGRIALGQSKNHPLNIWAVFSDHSTGGLSGIAKSTDGGLHWSPVAIPVPGPVWGTNYNLYVAVHPDSPNTVFLGTNRLFRTDTGDAPWTELGGIHMDHHAMVFDPTNSNIVYAGCDGGIYRADDGGTVFQQRNHNLSTLQFYCISNHPQWAAVMLGGTQDNGGAFSSGAPAWKTNQWPGLTHNEIGGDIVATGFDPVVPTRAYYMLYQQLYRSQDAGRFWDAKYTVGPPAEWLTPFTVDPTLEKVCFTGGNSLQRSADAGDSWATITPTLPGNITTIAVHPTNSNLVYVGTNQGTVHRVQRTGPDWSPPNVTTTDITGPPLPSGLYVSCVAVDNAGTVWVSFASVLATEATGEFTNDHVYRLPAGSTTWLNCSAGLAQANPINAIAVDPSNPDLVFCGGDQSVFRWDATANSWELWDQGLPNSPIMSLALHGPSRLLRAATYGRGIWERAIDNSPEPMVDIYMRDNILDSARCPAPCPVPHPFNPANLVWWYQSEDITVDAPPFQTPLPAPDDITLANSVVDCNPKRGMVNRFYIQVHNRGPLKATNVRVRAFLADASLALPSLPSDFWSSPKPFDGDPSAAYWTPIGSTKSAGDLGPCKTAVLCWEWAVPATAAQHSCLLAIATCDEDVLNLPGHFDIGDVVINYNNVTLKNMAIIP